MENSKDKIKQILAEDKKKFTQVYFTIKKGFKVNRSITKNWLPPFFSLVKEEKKWFMKVKTYPHTVKNINKVNTLQGDI